MVGPSLARSAGSRSPGSPASPGSSPIAWRLKPDVVAPAVAVVLLATCTPVAPFAGQGMLECLGLLLLTATLVAFDIYARRQGSPAAQVGLAVASIARPGYPYGSTTGSSWSWR